MHPDSDLPPQSTEPEFLDEMASLTGLFNPEIIWKEEVILDALDEQEAARASEPTEPGEHAPDQP